MSINNSIRLLMNAFYWNYNYLLINVIQNSMNVQQSNTFHCWPISGHNFTGLHNGTLYDKHHLLSNTGKLRALHVVLQLARSSLDKCLIHISNSPIKAHLPNTLANCSILALSPLKRSSMNLLMASTSILPFLICSEESITKYNTLFFRWHLLEQLR